MRSAIVAAVYAALREHCAIEQGETLVAAVSGGPDSLCLLHVLSELRGELGIALHVAHLDHMLRGAESAAEAAFVEATARGWGLPATIGRIDVPSIAQTSRANLHQAGRAARYGFLAQVAREHGARAVAVAHHAGDQAETVLMHLLRGAGPAGLCGMRPVSDFGFSILDFGSLSDDNLQNLKLIRPLLHVTRAEIEAYCAAHSLQPRRDPSNLDMSATRNRIRHELLPQLIEYNSHIVAALGRTAALCASEHDLVVQSLAAAWPALARERAGAVDLDSSAWREMHPAHQREALRRANAQLAGGPTLELEHVEAARAAASAGVGACADLPGGIALTVGYGGFTLGAPREIDGPQLVTEPIDVPVPGRAELAAGWALEASLPESGPEEALAADTVWQVELDAATASEPLMVRRRRPGDRFRPVSGPGRRRLQDMFVDAKVPRALRAGWPIVAVADAIVWVPGLRPPADFARTEATRRVLRLRVTRPTTSRKT
jgi:tRNA(Ile)-lysidine synthetase-like protein